MDAEMLRAELDRLAEPGYRDFQKALMPDSRLPLLGVRLPALRRLARKLVKTRGAGALALPGHDTFEEVMLRGMMIGCLYPSLPAAHVLELAAAFLDEIDSWALCDSFCAGLRPLAKGQPARLFAFAVGRLDDPRPYAVRFGVVTLLDFYLDEVHLPQVLAQLRGVQNSHFYVKMALAWALSMCCAAAPEPALAALRQWPDEWVRRKAVQKIRESRQISPAIKAQARALLAAPAAPGSVQLSARNNPVRRK